MTRKSEIDKLSASYAKRVASVDNSSKELRSRAKESLQAVESAYQVASDALEVLSTLLKQNSLTSKEALQLTTSLKNVTSVLLDAREEARRTVSDLSGRDTHVAPDPPGPVAASLRSASQTAIQFSVPKEIGVGILPTLAEAQENDFSDEE
jgi:hypothetical protein